MDLELNSNNLQTVVTAMRCAVEQLGHKNREAAWQTISGVSATIQRLQQLSQDREQEYKTLQANFAKMVSEIINYKNTLHTSLQGIQDGINRLKVEVEKKNTDHEETKKQIEGLRQQAADAENERRRHQAKLDQMNDNSAESIIRSIFCFGLDRAVMGIQTLVDNDQGRIDSLNKDLAKFNETLSGSLDRAQITSKVLNQLNTNKRSMEDTIGKLANTGKQLQDKEQALRNKGAFFTNVALFFGKLSVLATDVDHNVDDVVDLVQALDDTTPTIIDVKSPGNELVSLSDALYKFIHFYTADAPLLDESGITLSAQTARIQSVKEIPVANLETEHGRDNIGHWFDASETVTWAFALVSGGKFEVRATYACYPEKGGKFEARVEWVKAGWPAWCVFSGHARDTGGWNQFQEISLGYVELDQPGAYTLEVAPAVRDWKAMNLAEVRLLPVEHGVEVPLQPVEFGVILSAKTARIQSMQASPRAKLETGHGRDNIGDWYDASETVIWAFALVSGGKFEVRATYACDPEKGGEFETRIKWVKDRKSMQCVFSCHVWDTGGWNQFRQINLGYVELDQPGAYMLEITPVARDWKAMNLAEVQLLPVKPGVEVRLQPLLSDLVLSVRTARIQSVRESPLAKLETGHGQDNIGDWYDASETVTWMFVLESGASSRSG